MSVRPWTVRLSLAAMLLGLSLAGCSKNRPEPAAKSDGGKTETAALSPEEAEKAAQKNIRQLVKAMHAYANQTDDANSLPTQVIYGWQGASKDQPLYSWRVAILPQIGYAALYEKFKHDEPWDSPNNKALIEQMPDVFASAGGASKKGETYFKVFTGGGAWFDPKGRKGSSKLSPQDGAFNTILIVEGGDPVIWTKPDDLPYDPAKPLPNLTPPGGGSKLNIAMGGGTVFTTDMSRIKANEKDFRAMITNAGGETFDRDAIDPTPKPEPKSKSVSSRSR